MAADGHSDYNAAVESFREHEYPMLKEETYLDHAGTTLYSRSLVDRVAADMMANLLGNPHAASPSSQAAGLLVEDVRLRALQFLGADPTAFDLVFVANATAGIKLVTEAFRAFPRGFAYAYHQACHTSLVGVREEASCSTCVTSADVEAWTRASNKRVPSLLVSNDVNDVLFAYPAQSNMDGQRYPLSWASQVRNDNTDGPRVWTLLDAAAYASTSPLDLHDAASAPDFVVVSFYKIFGWPDLGALLIRRPAEALFDARRYFGGGTVDVVASSSGEQWHVTKREAPLHERLEDGTLPVHSIRALGAALDTQEKLFGTMERVTKHTSFLGRRLRTGLSALRHGSGEKVCELYGPPDNSSGIVAFNLRNSHGAWISLAEFDKLASLRRFHLRTGGVCNPGGIASALRLAPWELRRNFSAGLRCGGDDGDLNFQSDVVAGKPVGIIRASLGAMSTIADVDHFLAFVNEFYCDKIAEPTPALSLAPAASLFVSTISIYPIKSCGAFVVPTGLSWEVRPEGLAWDREWCLVHGGTGRALSQKQYPQMALLRPRLDFSAGVLRVSWGGRARTGVSEVAIPLSSNPAMFAPSPTQPPSSQSSQWPSRTSRVCGEEISAQVYTATAINDFFSDVLSVSCLLARFPPGGQGKSMRHAKAHLQRYQSKALPSPPDSDSERPKTRVDTTKNSPLTDRRILLSNESPILAIHMASVRALNADIQEGNGASSTKILADVFRANIVLDSRDSQADTPYAEDNWTHLRIGRQSFRMLGACRRCHMVCINQQTGVRSDEPFVTLAKTRRFDGKVFFGTHMAHSPLDTVTPTTPEQQYPTIMVGDPVEVEVY